MAGRLRAADGVEVLNDVVLNQVLVRFADDDAVTDAVIDARPARTGRAGSAAARSAAAP